jgi:hypothetical protein
LEPENHQFPFEKYSRIEEQTLVFFNILIFENAKKKKKKKKKTKNFLFYKKNFVKEFLKIYGNK